MELKPATHVRVALPFLGGGDSRETGLAPRKDEDQPRPLPHGTIEPLLANDEQRWDQGSVGRFPKRRKLQRAKRWPRASFVLAVDDDGFQYFERHVLTLEWRPHDTQH